MRYRQRPQLSRIVLSHTPRQLWSCLIFDVRQIGDFGKRSAPFYRKENTISLNPNRFVSAANIKSAAGAADFQNHQPVEIKSDYQPERCGHHQPAEKIQTISTKRKIYRV